MSAARDPFVLDPEVIETLRALAAETDPNLFAELVRLFLEESPSKLRALSEGLGGGDATAVERSAHSLKSSAANLGATSLANLLAEIETAGRARDLERVGSLLPRTAREYDQARAALRDLVRT